MSLYLCNDMGVTPGVEWRIPVKKQYVRNIFNYLCRLSNIVKVIRIMYLLQCIY